MNQILHYPLWLGHSGEGRDFRQIFDSGIKALVQVAAEELPPQPPRELIVCHFPLMDSSGNRAELLFVAISTLATLLKLHVPTLVCSGSGVSRAPAIAAAALAMIRQESPQECLQRVVEHYRSDVSPGFWSEVLAVLPSAANEAK
jgi:hypothetical protein